MLTGAKRLMRRRIGIAFTAASTDFCWLLVYLWLRLLVRVAIGISCYRYFIMFSSACVVPVYLKRLQIVFLLSLLTSVLKDIRVTLKHRVL